MDFACLFDIDNTLYDYDAAHAGAYRALTEYASRELGLDAEAFDALHRMADGILRRHSGGNCAAIHNRLIRYQLMLEQIGRPLSHAPVMAETYWSTFLSVITAYPDAASCLERLKAAGHTVGIGTNMTADYQFAKLEKLGLLGYADFIVSSEEAGAEKPDPRFFACCAEKAGREPSLCVFVGDSLQNDALGALRAGMRAVWLCRGTSDAPAPSEVERIRSLAELFDLLEIKA